MPVEEKFPVDRGRSLRPNTRGISLSGEYVSYKISLLKIYVVEIIGCFCKYEYIPFRFERKGTQIFTNRSLSIYPSKERGCMADKEIKYKVLQAR